MATLNRAKDGVWHGIGWLLLLGIQSTRFIRGIPKRTSSFPLTILTTPFFLSLASADSLSLSRRKNFGLVLRNGSLRNKSLPHHTSFLSNRTNGSGKECK